MIYYARDIMKLSLSTNWCNRRLETGEAIAEKALELGFEELELGFHTTLAQVPGFKKMLSRIPVGSVHAFCPVPLSAPQGYPELYTLASLDEDARGLARFHVKKNIAFAAEMGADTVVLHARRSTAASSGAASIRGRCTTRWRRRRETATTRATASCSRRPARCATRARRNSWTSSAAKSPRSCPSSKNAA